MKIVMYSLDGCGHCDVARSYFIENNVEYTELKVDRDISIDDFLDQFPEQTGFPHIVIDGKMVDQYKEHIEMNTMLKGVSL